MPDDVALPSTEELNQKALSPQPQPESLSDFEAILSNAASSSGLYMDMGKALINEGNPGPTVPATDPGLEEVYPHGVPENVQKFIENSKIQTAINDQQIAQMPGGALNNLAKYTVGTIGGLLEPVGAASLLAGAAIIPELKLGETLFDAGSKAANVINKTAKDVSLGEIYNTSVNTGQYESAKSIGENPDPNMIVNGQLSLLKQGAFFGILHGIFGKVAVNNTDMHEAAVKTAVSQVGSDVLPNVDPIIQQGLAETRANLQSQTLNPELTQQASDALGQYAADLDNSLENYPAPKPVRDLLGSAQLNNLNENLGNVMELTGSQLKYNSDVQNLDYMKKIGDISSKNPLARTQEESQTITKFMSDPFFERNLIKDELKTNTRELRDIQTKSNELNISKEEMDNQISDQEKDVKYFNNNSTKEEFRNYQLSFHGFKSGDETQLQRNIDLHQTFLKDMINKNERAEKIETVQNSLNDAISKLKNFRKISDDVENEYKLRREKFFYDTTDLYQKRDNIQDDLNRYNNRLELLKNKIKNLNSRQNSLNKLEQVKNEKPDVFENARMREYIRHKISDTYNMKNDHDAAQVILNSRSPTKSAIIGEQVRANSVSGDNYLNVKDGDDTDRVFGLNDTIDDYKKDMEEKIKRGELTEEDLDKMESEDAKGKEYIATITKAARDYFECIRGLK